MPASQSAELQARLIAIAQKSGWFMSALEAVHELGLASWCIGAGAVRNLVWDALHGFSEPSALADIDVAYFDSAVLAPEYDAKFQARLDAILPDVRWDVVNQAAVHYWFEGYFGRPVKPLLSLEEAVASWPEYATSIGLTLTASNSIRVIAPHGLEDLFSLMVRHNPTRASVNIYRQRIEQKRYTERWPRVTIVPC